MELELFLPGESSKQSLGVLIDYIEKASVESLKHAQISTGPWGNSAGEMGGPAMLNSITLLIHAAQKPLVELVKCLQKYVDNYRTKITISTKDGESIVLEHGRSMTPEQLTKLIRTIQESNSQG